MSKASIIVDGLSFLRQRKQLWLAPFILFMLFFGVVIALAEGSVLGPFMYTLF